MKKLGLCLLLLTVLSGCSGKQTEINRGLAFRTKLLETSGFSFDTDITADYGDKLHQFSMACRADEKGNVTFTVTDPETIDGISGTITENSGAMTFDDTALHFDLLTDAQLSPVSAPWILMKMLRNGYLTSACQEETELHLTIDDTYADEPLTMDIWLNEQDFPVRAEVLYSGRRILTLTVANAAFM